MIARYCYYTKRRHSSAGPSPSGRVPWAPLDPRERWSLDGREREAEPRHDVAALEVARGAERMWRRGAAQPPPPPCCNEAASLGVQRRLFTGTLGRGARAATGGLAENAGSVPVPIGDCCPCVS